MARVIVSMMFSSTRVCPECDTARFTAPHPALPLHNSCFFAAMDWISAGILLPRANCRSCAPGCWHRVGGAGWVAGEAVRGAGRRDRRGDARADRREMGEEPRARMGEEPRSDGRADAGGAVRGDERLAYRLQ